MQIASLSELINRQHINNMLRGLAMPLPSSHPCLVSLPQSTAQNLSPWFLCPSPSDWALNSGVFLFVLFCLLFVCFLSFLLILNLSQIQILKFSCFYKLYCFVDKWKQPHLSVCYWLFFPGLMVRDLVLSGFILYIMWDGTYFSLVINVWLHGYSVYNIDMYKYIALSWNY